MAVATHLLDLDRSGARFRVERLCDHCGVDTHLFSTKRGDALGLGTGLDLEADEGVGSAVGGSRVELARGAAGADRGGAACVSREESRACLVLREGLGHLSIELRGEWRRPTAIGAVVNRRNGGRIAQLAVKCNFLANCGELS